MAWDGVALGGESARSGGESARSVDDNGDILTDFYATKAEGLGLFPGRYQDSSSRQPEGAASAADEDGNAQTKKISS
jgi:hypothetical protein